MLAPLPQLRAAASSPSGDSFAEAQLGTIIGSPTNAYDRPRTRTVAHGRVQSPTERLNLLCESHSSPVRAVDENLLPQIAQISEFLWPSPRTWRARTGSMPERDQPTLRGIDLLKIDLPQRPYNRNVSSALQRLIHECKNGSWTETSSPVATSDHAKE